jgi:hypothetical protein
MISAVQLNVDAQRLFAKPSDIWIGFYDHAVVALEIAVEVDVSI